MSAHAAVSSHGLTISLCERPAFKTRTGGNVSLYSNSQPTPCRISSRASAVPSLTSSHMWDTTSPVSTLRACPSACSDSSTYGAFRNAHRPCLNTRYSVTVEINTPVNAVQSERLMPATVAALT